MSEVPNEYQQLNLKVYVGDIKIHACRVPKAVLKVVSKLILCD